MVLHNPVPKVKKKMGLMKNFHLQRNILQNNEGHFIR